MHDDPLAYLGPLLARRFPERRDVAVVRWSRISTGWESDVYAFDLEYGPPGARESQPLILRLYPGTATDPTLGAAAKAAHEFRVLSLLGEAGYPVPATLLLETGSAALGHPFVIMERIDGEALGRLLRRAAPAEQDAWRRRMMELMVRLHRLDWHPFVDEPAAYEAVDGRGHLRVALERWRSQGAALPLAGDGSAEALWDWVNEGLRRVPRGQPALVHLDWHAQNILLRADGSPVVIDWTSAEVTDPRVDLAWTLVLHQGGGPARQATIVREYERASGRAVEGLDFFLALARWRRVWSMTAALRLGAAAVGMRPGAEEAIRRQLPLLAEHYGALRDATGLRMPAVEDLLGEDAATAC